MNIKRLLTLSVVAIMPLFLFQNCGRPFNLASSFNGTSASSGEPNGSSNPDVSGSTDTGDSGSGNSGVVGQVVPPPEFLDPVVTASPSPTPSPSASPDDTTVAGGSPTPSEDPSTDPVVVDPPSDSDLGTCEIADTGGHHKKIGKSHVKSSDFARENGKQCSKNKDKDEGEFLAPVDDDSKVVCVTRKACEGTLVHYLKHSKGILLGKPNPNSAWQISNDSGLVIFKKDKSCKKEKKHKKLSDDEFGQCLDHLADRWGHHNDDDDNDDSENDHDDHSHKK